MVKKFTRYAVVASVCANLPGALSSQTLPDPRASRSPVMAEVSAEERKGMAAQLQLNTMLALIQQGDAPAFGVLMRQVSWVGSDQQARLRTGCETPSAALSGAKAQLRAEAPLTGRAKESTLQPWLDQIEMRDSGSVVTVTGLLHIAPGTSVSRSGVVRLALNVETMTLVEVEGLLSTLCP